MAQTILVTGGAGFIGSHTVVELLAAGNDVVVVDDLSNASAAAIDAVQAIAGRSVTFVRADVADASALESVFSAHRIDAVVHFAAFKAVGESVAEPLRYYRNNLGSTFALVEAMARHDVRRLVFSSSCTVYGNPETMPITEDFPLGAVSPYGRTKVMNEEILSDVAASGGGWRIALLRYFNPVGAHPSGELGEDPRGVPNNVMPYLMQVAVGRRDKLSVFGGDYPTRDGTAVRDYIHVMDLAAGHLAAIDALDAGPAGCRAFNLGTGQGTTVLELIAAASRAVGKPIPYEIVDRRPGDAVQVWADPAYANSELGWKAVRDIDDMCVDHWRWQSRHPWGFADGPA